MDWGDDIGDRMKNNVMRRFWESVREGMREHMRNKQMANQPMRMGIDGTEELGVITAELDRLKIPYEVQRNMSVNAMGEMQERATLSFKPKDCEKVNQVADEQLKLLAVQRHLDTADLGKCSIQLNTDAQTAALTDALQRAGIPYDVQRTTLAADKDGEVQARASVSFPEPEFERVRAIAQDVFERDRGKDAPEGARELPDKSKNIGLPNKDKEFVDSIRAKVESAREGAVSVEDFEARCRAAGLSVERASDGELKFSENGWFEVRGNTLGEEFSVKSFEKTPQQKAAEDPIKSHDGADIDTRTGVVESVVDTPGDGTATREVQGEERAEPYYKDGADLDAEEHEARDASSAIAEEHGAPDVTREAPNFQDIGER